MLLVLLEATDTFVEGADAGSYRPFATLYEPQARRLGGVEMMFQRVHEVLDLVHLALSAEGAAMARGVGVRVEVGDHHRGAPVGDAAEFVIGGVDIGDSVSALAASCRTDARSPRLNAALASFNISHP